MCLAIPLKLIQIQGLEALGEAEGFTRPIRVDFIRDPKVGEYVMVHAGFAIERLNPREAQAGLEAWREVLKHG